MTLRSLRTEIAVSHNEDATNESDSLNLLVKRINCLSPQFPEDFRSEENNIQFLWDAVIGSEWASQDISQITTSKYSFDGFVSALREGLRYIEELRRHKRLSTPSLGKECGPLLYQQYRFPPRSVEVKAPFESKQCTEPHEHSSTHESPRSKWRANEMVPWWLWLPSTTISLGGPQKNTRNRLASGESAIHIIGDLVNEIDGIVIHRDTKDSDINRSIGLQDRV